MREQELQQKIRAVLCHPDAPTRLWRNNVGAWKNEETGEFVEYGLAKGSADLVGIHRVVITPDMVGQAFGRFFAAEIKTPIGRVSAAQKAWLQTVKDFGGLAVVLRSVEEAENILRSNNNGIG
jgi:hypothetical protein